MSFSISRTHIDRLLLQNKHQNSHSKRRTVNSPYSSVFSFSNRPPSFPTCISNILSHKPYPTVSTTTWKFQHTFPIYVGISNIKHIFPTQFSNILFYKRRRGAFAPPSHLLALSTYLFQPPSAVPIHQYSSGSVPAYSFR